MGSSQRRRVVRARRGHGELRGSEVPDRRREQARHDVPVGWAAVQPASDRPLRCPPPASRWTRPRRLGRRPLGIDVPMGWSDTGTRSRVTRSAPRVPRWVRIRPEPLPRPAGFLPATALSTDGGPVRDAPSTPGAPVVVRPAVSRWPGLPRGGGSPARLGMHAFDHTSTSTAAAATSVQTIAGAKSIADVVSAVDPEVVSITVRGRNRPTRVPVSSYAATG